MISSLEFESDSFGLLCFIKRFKNIDFGGTGVSSPPINIFFTLLYWLIGELSPEKILFFELDLLTKSGVNLLARLLA